MTLAPQKSGAGLLARGGLAGLASAGQIAVTSCQARAAGALLLQPATFSVGSMSKRQAKPTEAGTHAAQQALRCMRLHHPTPQNSGSHGINNSESERLCPLCGHFRHSVERPLNCDRRINRRADLGLRPSLSVPESPLRAGRSAHRARQSPSRHRPLRSAAGYAGGNSSPTQRR